MTVGQSGDPNRALLLPDAEPAPHRRARVHPPSRVGNADLLAGIAREAGLTGAHFVAWRDLDDPEAGGSELHAHRIASLWAAAGIDVTVRTSAVAGKPETSRRDGYRVTRRSGRYAVFADVAWQGLRSGRRPGEGLVEVWNGMPFFSPLWHRGPRIVFLHHVHAEMWRMVLPRSLASVGELVESRLAPPLYRRTRIVTLSESSRREIVGMLGLPEDRVTVAAPGVESRFSPGSGSAPGSGPGSAPGRSPTPLVLAVGRLVPVKRFDLLIDALVRVRRHVPQLRAVLVGEGYERPALEALRHRLGADDWIELPGRLSDDEVADWYRRAWLVASASQREGWGMTLTEAGACGTPAVASDIAGHRDAVMDGRTGLLAEGVEGLAGAIRQVLEDADLRARLSKGALERARWFTWDATARSALEALAAEFGRRPAARG